MIDSRDTILIGVDGGGTGCRAAVGTMHQGILSQAEGGRANFASNPDLAIKNVLDSIQCAAAKAGISIETSRPVSAHLGLAGVMTEKDSATVAAALPFKEITVTDDRPAAIHGALGGQDGFLLSVGTGTIAAVSKNGAYRSVSGWGFHLADQASGAWLGHRTLRQVLRCHDGLAEFTDLTREIFARFQSDPNKIVAHSMSAKPGDYGELAPLIIERSRANDPWGLEIMRSGADFLNQCLNALGYKAGDRICLSGGVGPHYARHLPTKTLAGRIDRIGSAIEGAFELAKTRSAKQVKANL